MLKKYELLLTLPGTLDDNEAAKQAKEILELVKSTDQNAEMNNIGKMRLAYPIKQIRYGYFQTVVFEAEAGDVKKLEEKLKTRTDVLRFLVSHFNTNIVAAKKIVYSTNDAGVTTMLEKNNEEVQPVVERKNNVDLKDIDKKLNEILDGDIITGV